MSMIQLKKSRAMKECEKARIPRVWVEAIIFVAMLILFQVAAQIILPPIASALIRGMDEDGIYVVVTILTNLMFVMLIIVPILYCRLVEKRSIAGMGLYGNGVKSVLIGALAGFGLTVLVAGIQLLFGAGLIQWAGTLPVVSGILILLSTFVQSSGEEVLCRGFLMNGLAHKHSWIFAAAGNSVVFGLIHLANPGISPLAVINVTIAGILFSVITIRYNLWVSCGVHTMWNFSEGFIFGSNISGNAAQMSAFAVSPTNKPAWLTGGEFGIEGSIVVTIIYLIGIVLILLLPQSSKGKTSETN